MKWTSTPLGLGSLLLSLPTDLLALLPTPALKLAGNLTWPQLIALLSFPVCAMKQIINCVQFWKASKVLVESDQEERWEKLQAKSK